MKEYTINLCSDILRFGKSVLVLNSFDNVSIFNSFFRARQKFLGLKIGRIFSRNEQIYWIPSNGHEIFWAKRGSHS